MRTLEILAVALLFAATPALAQDEPLPPAEAPPEDGAEFEEPGDADPLAEELPGEPEPAPEPAPEPGKAKMVLETGETLLGELLQISDGKVKFKSEQLGELTIPFEKIARLRSAKSHKVILETGEIIEGRVEIDGGDVKVVRAGSDEVVSTRSDLSGVNPDPEKTELDYWKFSATVGVTLTYGNARSQNAGALALLSREDDWTKGSVGYTAAYGQNSDGENAKSHRLDGQVDLKITDMFYLTPFVGNGLYDKFQNIHFRYRVGGGAGYYFFKSDVLSWNVEGGFSYGETEFRRVTPPTKKMQYDTSVRAATGFLWAINEMVALNLSWETYVGTKYVRDTVHHGVANLSFKLAQGVALSIAAIYDRNEHPIRDSTGHRPSENDLKLILGLSVAM